ncbi:MAG: glycerophosphodiester phosphodiesterase [Kiloniellales bacterium]
MAKHRRKSGKLSTASWAWLGVTGLLLLVGVASLLLVTGSGDGRPVLPPGFDLQGHRGARGLAPENSLPGFAAAMAVGVTTLEMDAVMTADGVPVLYHDLTLHPIRTRLRGGDWLSWDEPRPALIALSRAELAAYDVGRIRPGTREAERFPQQLGIDGVGIPTLAEAIAQGEKVSGGRMRYNIETKLSPETPDLAPTPEDFAAAVVGVIRKAGVTERASVQSFDWRSLQAVQKLAPEIATVYLTAEHDWLDNLQRGKPGPSPWTAGFDIDDFDGSVPRLVQAAGGTVWSPQFRNLREADLLEAKRIGLPVVPWTVNDPADMASLIERGVDGLITDYPDRLRAVMEELDLPLPPAFGP